MKRTGLLTLTALLPRWRKERGRENRKPLPVVQLERTA